MAKGVFWIVEGSVASYYRNKEYESKQYKAGDSLFKFQFFDKPSLLTYEAKQRTVVLVVPMETLNSLFLKYVYDRQAFEEKAEKELEIMTREKRNLKDRFLARRFWLNLVHIRDHTGKALCTQKTLSERNKDEEKRVAQTAPRPPPPKSLNSILPVNNLVGAKDKKRQQGVTTPSLFEILNSPADDEIESYRELLNKNKKREKLVRHLAADLYKASPLDAQALSKNNSAEGKDLHHSDIFENQLTSFIKSNLQLDISYDEDFGGDKDDQNPTESADQAVKKKDVFDIDSDTCSDKLDYSIEYAPGARVSMKDLDADLEDLLLSNKVTTFLIKAKLYQVRYKMDQLSSKASDTLEKSILLLKKLRS